MLTTEPASNLDAGSVTRAASVGGYVISEPISFRDCLSLLDSEHVGRLGVSINALPAVLPINYLLVGETLFLRASDKGKLFRACLGSVVAFETDGYDSSSDSGWSVLVRGVVSEVPRGNDLESARRLWREAWPLSEDADRFLMLPISDVCGWRFVKRN